MKKIKTKDIKIGGKYGRLTVLERVKEKRSGHTRTFYICKCECGNITKVRNDGITSGRARSCGCYARESRSERMLTHGMSETRFYKIWVGMRQRCYNEKDTGYKYYGGRGITVCDRWNKFENFYDDMYESYLKHVKEHGEENTSIDRIDNNGNYEPSNCRWTNQTKQLINQRERSDNTSGHTGVSWNKLRNKWRAYITIDGKIKHLGYFVEKEMAIRVRRAYEARYYNTIQINGATYDINLLAANFYAKKESERAV